MGGDKLPFFKGCEIRPGYRTPKWSSQSAIFLQPRWLIVSYLTEHDFKWKETHGSATQQQSAFVTVTISWNVSTLMSQHAWTLVEQSDITANNGSIVHVLSAHVLMAALIVSGTMSTLHMDCLKLTNWWLVNNAMLLSRHEKQPLVVKVQ